MKEMICTACGGRQFEPKIGVGFVCEHCQANYLAEKETVEVNSPVIGYGGYSSPYKPIIGYIYKGEK